MTNRAASTTRPWTATVVIVLAILTFAEQLLVGILGWSEAPELDAEFSWTSTDSLTQSQIIAGSIAAIVLAVLGLIAIAAYSRGSRNGLISLAILTTLAVASGLITMRGYGEFRPALGAGRLVCGIVVLFLLFQQRDQASDR